MKHLEIPYNDNARIHLNAIAALKYHTWTSITVQAAVYEITTITPNPTNASFKRFKTFHMRVK